MLERARRSAPLPARHRVFTRLLPRHIVGMGARIFFALFPAMLIVLLAGLLVEHDIEEALQAANTEAVAGMALSRLAESDAHLQRAAGALENYRATGLAPYRTEYLVQKLGANLNLLAAPLRGQELRPQFTEPLRAIQWAAERYVAEMDVLADHPVRGPTAAAALRAARDGYERLLENYRHIELARQPVGQEIFVSQVKEAKWHVLLAVVFAAAVQMWMFILIERNQVARRQAEAVVEQTEQQFTAAADVIPAMIAYAGVDNAMLYHNATFARWLGRAGDGMAGLNLPALFGPASRDLLESKAEAALAGTPVDFEFKLIHLLDGQHKDLSAHFIPHLDRDGAVLGYFTFFSDVTEFKNLERLKSEFVTTVSHELRTPLTAMQGALGLVTGGLTGAISDKTRGMLEIAQENCQRLGRIVNDIIDTERMEANRMDFSIGLIDAGDVVARAMRQCEPLEVTYGVRLAPLSRSLSHAPVLADEDRLLQVITNLLSNACKFSPQGAQVEVSLEQQGSMVRVNVSDRGPGVPGIFRDQLFGRFARFVATDARRAGGSGLGLNISKRFMEQMGGTIAYSDRPGGGSIFYIELPLEDGQPEIRPEIKAETKPDTRGVLP